MGNKELQLHSYRPRWDHSEDGAIRVLQNGQLIVFFRAYIVRGVVSVGRTWRFVAESYGCRTALTPSAAAAPVPRGRCMIANSSRFCSFTHVTPGRVMDGQASLATIYAGHFLLAYSMDPKYTRKFLEKGGSYFGLFFLPKPGRDAFESCALHDLVIPSSVARN